MFLLFPTQNPENRKQMKIGCGCIFVTSGENISTENDNIKQTKHIPCTFYVLQCNFFRGTLILK